MISVFNFLTSVKSRLYVSKHFKLYHPVLLLPWCAITTNEKPMHRNQRVAPAHCDQRKPAHSNKDPAPIKIIKFKKF